jgi:4-hydroxy-2-oxoheptanedioate aldolase
MTTRDSFSLARRLRAGETVYTAWCALPYPIVAEAVAREGFTAAVLDQQHGLWDTAAMVLAIATLRQGGAAPVVRIPVADFSTASRALDFGAEGIIAPMINTVADARAFVSVTKYPPLGDRSWGPHRALMQANEKNPQAYLREANELTFTFAMIETRTALDNVEAIAATNGINALFVGPWDLSIALSNGAEANPHTDAVKQALGQIVAAANKAKKIAGLYCGNAEEAMTAAKQGFRFLAIGSDLAFLRAGAAAQIKALRG